MSPLQGLKLGRRAVAIGFVLSAATATAVGAASGHTPWPEPARPSFSTTSEQPHVTEASPPTTVPAAVEPTTTVSAVVAPVVPVVEQTPGPSQPATAEPATTQPTPAAPTPEPVAEESTTTEAVAAAPPPAAPAPASHDNHVPETLSMTCAPTDGSMAPVSCSWSGETPAGFALFVLLRGDPDGKGRVPFRSSTPGAGSFVDATPSAGGHSYVLVALDSAEHPLAHSNMVLVQIAAA